jgi:hypothetical protein
MSSHPSNAVFEAVLYGEDPSKLDEPLLTNNINCDQVEYTMATSTRSQYSLKLLACITGSIVAVISQRLLTLMLWNEEILSGSTVQVIAFSLHWSFWTCLSVFGSMLLFVNTIERLQQNTLNDDMVFQMEAHYVVGSLLTISAVWLLDDVLVLQEMRHPVLVVTAAVVAYAIFLGCIVHSKSTNNKNYDSMVSTYTLVAGALGVVVGVCSQFLLSLLLWKDADLTVPAVESITVFSLLWSVLTVALTATGCLSLRCVCDNQRTLLRMEAVYIGSSLAGICAAWILIDVANDMPEQVLPSVLLLAASLAAFGLILRCFPEDKCLVDAPPTMTKSPVILQIV